MTRRYNRLTRRGLTRTGVRRIFRLPEFTRTTMAGGSSGILFIGVFFGN